MALTDDVLAVVGSLGDGVPEELYVPQIRQFGQLSYVSKRCDLVAVQVQRLQPREAQDVVVDSRQQVKRHVEPF